MKTAKQKNKEIKAADKEFRKKFLPALIKATNKVLK